MRISILSTSSAALLALLLTFPPTAEAVWQTGDASYTAADHPLVLAGYSNAQWRHERDVGPTHSAAATAPHGAPASWYARRLDRLAPASVAAFEAATPTGGGDASVRSGGGCTVRRVAINRPWC